MARRAIIPLLLTLLLLPPVTGFGANICIPPPPPGSVGSILWIHVPGVSGNAPYTVSWGPAARADAYVLQEDTLPSFPAPRVAYQGSARRFTVAKQKDGTYFYRVCGMNTTYKTFGFWRTADHPHVVDRSVGTIPAVPAPPSAITAGPIADNGSPSQQVFVLNVAWRFVSGATGYDLRYGVSDWPIIWFPNRVSNVAQNPWSITVTRYYAAPRKNCYFQVRTRVNVGSYRLYSPWSKTAVALVDRSAVSPTQPRPLMVPPSSRTGSITLNWGDAVNATVYELEECPNGTFANPATVYRGIATTTTLTGRGNGSYYYRVRGTNPLCTSPWWPYSP
ncbi:MAG: hypothetical protein ACYS47_19095, partial [Planctomycetota bacterium]